MTLDANDLPDEMDLASSEYLQSFTFRLRGREKVFLDKIQKALEKIEDGTLRRLRRVRRGDLDQAPRSAPRDDALHPLQRGSGARGKRLRLRRRSAPARRASRSRAAVRLAPRRLRLAATPCADGVACARSSDAARGSGRCGCSALAATCFGRALGHDRAAAVAALGAEVDDPVGAGDDVEVVLDDDDVLPASRRPSERVRSGARCPRSAGPWSARRARRACGRWPCARARVASFTRCASPPESVVAGWPSCDVAEADLAQRGEPLADARDRLEQLDRLRRP